MNPRNFNKVHFVCMTSIHEQEGPAASDFKEANIEISWSHYLMKRTTNVTTP